MYMAVLQISSIRHTFRVAQIAVLLWNKCPTKNYFKYLDYISIFLFRLLIELLKNININRQAINLVKSKQLPYRLLYSPNLEELKELKYYIKSYL